MKPMNKLFFLPAILVPFGIRLGYEIWHDTIAAGDPLASMGGAIANPIAVFGIIIYLSFVYKLWDAIQDGKTRPSSALAAGLLLVPLLNMFWRFKAFLGWTVEYKKYADRNRLRVPTIPTWSFLAYSVIGLATGIMEYFDRFWEPGWMVALSYGLRAINLVILGIVISHGCDAVNALIEQDVPIESQQKLSQKQLVFAGIVAGIVLLVGTIIVSERQLLVSAGNKQEITFAVESMKTIRNAVNYYYDDTGGYPATVKELLDNQYLLLDSNVMRKWQFSIVGNPPTKIQATSSRDMPGGKGNSILYDLEKETFSGYGQK